MAQQLETENPDIIFAELLQLGDPHTDNINRRAAIYSYRNTGHRSIVIGQSKAATAI